MPSSRASPTACATRSSFCGSWASARRVGRVSGGGARSRLWLQIVASTLGIPLELTAAEEGAAFGAALLGAVAAGAFSDVHEAVEECVRPRERFEPDAGWMRAYEAGYPRFRALYPSLEHLEER